MVLSSLPHAADGAPDLVAMLEAAGRLWLAGTPVRWPALHDQRRRRVPLPTYPFERQRHLVDMVPARGPAVPAAAGRDAARTPLAGEVEHAVAVLFAEVLGVEHIGGDDSFFELGGDSLVASQPIARVRETFAVPVPLESIFEAPTVAGLAGRLESMMSGLEVDETADEQLGHVL